MVEVVGVNRNGQKLYQNPDWLYDQDQKAAAAQQASLYYQSSIAPAVQSGAHSAKAESTVKVETGKTQKTWFVQTKDWLWNLFGINKKQPEATSQQYNDDETFSLSGPPRLERPKDLGKLSSELVHRCKDSAEFEEEMRKSVGNLTDAWIFMLLVNSGLYQKNLKEEQSIGSHFFVMQKQKRNQLLQEAHTKLMDEIKSQTKTKKALEWTNIGLSVGVIGAMAVTYAIGGPVALFFGGVTSGLLGLTRGGTTIAQGVMQRNADVATGDLHVANQEIKANSKKIKDEVEFMQDYNEEIGELMKSIRRIIDDYNTAMRGYFGRNS